MELRQLVVRRQRASHGLRTSSTQLAVIQREDSQVR
jgi:hypothetical protein